MTSLSVKISPEILCFFDKRSLWWDNWLRFNHLQQGDNSVTAVLRPFCPYIQKSPQRRIACYNSRIKRWPASRCAMKWLSLRAPGRLSPSTSSQLITYFATNSPLLLPTRIITSHTLLLRKWKVFMSGKYREPPCVHETNSHEMVPASRISRSENLRASS